MPTLTKRFRIKDPSGRREMTKHETLSEVVATLTSGSCDIENQYYYIECVIDDIEIPADELLESWKSGERPEDLQMF
jgi:hypothetical protein